MSRREAPRALEPTLHAGTHAGECNIAFETDAGECKYCCETDAYSVLYRQLAESSCQQHVKGDRGMNIEDVGAASIATSSV